MLLGYNTNGLQNHRLEDALRLLADTGYRAVALTPDVGHLDPLRCTARQVEEVAALLQRLDLHPVIETGARFVLDPAVKHEPTLMTRDPDARQRRLDFYGRCAEIGRDLGAGVLSFWAGVDRAAGPVDQQRLDTPCDGRVAPDEAVVADAVGGCRRRSGALGFGENGRALPFEHGGVGKATHVVIVGRQPLIQLGLFSFIQRAI